MQENTAKPFLDPILVSLMKKEVSKSKEADEPVNRAFEVIAEKSGLKFNTVRNYYYRYIHEKDNKNSRANTETQSRRGDVAGNTFTEQEVKDLMMAMLIGQAKGKSVRGCAKELANNDKKLMLRYQNKYRNVIAGNPEYVRELMDEMASKGLVYYNPLNKQVVHGKAFDSEGELFDNVGRLVSNINEIDSPQLYKFLAGLQELTSMALQYKRQSKEKNQGQLISIINKLIDINKRFLDLPPAAKLTGLSEYIRQVENCIKEMDKISC
ncbi:MAG: hypothetical protein GX054_10885 [Clostridiales bacterium]|nr:hypothetical protein [Clostridiales bacterium]